MHGAHGVVGYHARLAPVFARGVGFNSQCVHFETFWCSSLQLPIVAPLVSRPVVCTATTVDDIETMNDG